jgi:hypothetical protein
MRITENATGRRSVIQSLLAIVAGAGSLFVCGSSATVEPAGSFADAC